MEWEKAEGRGDDAKAENEAEGGVAVDSADARDRPQPADGERAVVELELTADALASQPLPLFTTDCK